MLQQTVDVKDPSAVVTLGFLLFLDMLLWVFGADMRAAGHSSPLCGLVWKRPDGSSATHPGRQRTLQATELASQLTSCIIMESLYCRMIMGLLGLYCRV